MRARRGLLSVVSLLTAAAASAPAAPAANARCAHARSAAAQLSPTAARRALLCLVNGERRRHGAPRVRAAGRLRVAATRHSADMAANDYFAHDAPSGATVTDRVRATGYLDDARSWALGETIAWSRGQAATPLGVLRMFLGSSPHRAILLDPSFRDLGVGIARGAPAGPEAGALTVTLDFGRREG
jgi:uncharacterized protein YkwD